MNTIKRYKYYIISMFVILGIIITPPVLHQEKYLIINGDTQAHIEAFEQMKNGNSNTIYMAQKVTGYFMIYLEKITKINIKSLFMWFNFIALFFASFVTSIMITRITKSELTGIISAFIIIWGTNSTIHLFYCGTIFNIIEFLILFPVFLLIVDFIVKSKKYLWSLLLIPVGAMLYFYHPSLGSGILTLFSRIGDKESVVNPLATFLLFFGIVNLIIFSSCSVAMLFNKIRNIENKTKIAITILIGLVFYVIAITDVCPFSARALYNACMMLTICMFIVIGNVVKLRIKAVNIGLLIFTVCSILPNLITWLYCPSSKEVIHVITG